MKVLILIATLAISSAVPYFGEYDDGPDSSEGDFDSNSFEPGSHEDHFHPNSFGSNSFEDHSGHSPDDINKNWAGPYAPLMTSTTTTTTTTTVPTTTTTTVPTTTTTSAPTTTTTTAPTSTTTSAPITTITSAPTLTTTSAPTTTTKQPTTEECIKKCLTTFEFSPVCGTDGKTYMNIELLRCTSNCGFNIDKLSDGVCPISTTTSAPTTTTKRPTTQECLKTCSFSYEFSPVCGTDGATYINVEFLQCNIKCGVAVQMLRPGMCSSTPSSSVPSSTMTTTSTTSTTTSTPTPTTTLTPTTAKTNTLGTLPTESLQACARRCMMSQSLNYKPACGTDGKIYYNIQALLCTKRCGKNVDAMSLSACFNGSGSESSNESPDIDVRYGI